MDAAEHSVQWQDWVLALEMRQCHLERLLTSWRDIWGSGIDWMWRGFELRQGGYLLPSHSAPLGSPTLPLLRMLLSFFVLLGTST